jgi:hypothetical protein
MGSRSKFRPQPEHIWQMMERLGIEAGAGALPRWSLSYATALHRCERCTSKPACREWLSATHGPAAFAPRFCPNADIFLELQFDQLGHEPFDRPDADSGAH